MYDIIINNNSNYFGEIYILYSYLTYGYMDIVYLRSKPLLLRPFCARSSLIIGPSFLNDLVCICYDLECFGMIQNIIYFRIWQIDV